MCVCVQVADPEMLTMMELFSNPDNQALLKAKMEEMKDVRLAAGGVVRWWLCGSGVTAPTRLRVCMCAMPRVVGGLVAPQPHSADNTPGRMPDELEGPSAAPTATQFA